MSIGSIGAVASSVAVSSVAHQRRADFHALGLALQNGDLAGAQSAFADLAKLLQSNGQSTSATASGTGSSTPVPGTGSPLQADFEALSKALQAGDISTAKSAFGQLMKALKAARGQHAGSAQAATPAATADADGDSDGSGGSAGPAQRGSLNVVA